MVKPTNNSQYNKQYNILSAVNSTEVIKTFIL